MIYSKFILDAKIFLYYIPYIVNILYYKYSCEKNTINSDINRWTGIIIFHITTIHSDLYSYCASALNSEIFFIIELENYSCRTYLNYYVLPIRMFS